MFAAPACMLALLAAPAAARVIWIPEKFDTFEDHTLSRRDDSTDLVSCGSSFPADFTCPATAQCLQLATNASITAVLCCPSGQSCSVIQPVSCDQSAQNATTTPNSELHSDPTVALDTCGSKCCPIGASCSSGNCFMQYASSATAGSGSSTTSSSSAAQSTAATAPGSSTSTYSDSGVVVTPTSVQSTITPTASGGNISTISGDSGTTTGSGHGFDGASFAAGLIPGLFIGAVLLGLAFMFRYRKKRKSIMIYMNEKHSKTRDTLGSLGPLSRRPTFHGRSISEPVDASIGYRTDFLRTTPPRDQDMMRANDGYSVEITGPSSGPSTPNRVSRAFKGFLSHSPFLGLTPKTPKPTQSPIPAHLKRGTLSMGVAIRPVRSLKKQKSMHSLRRQMTQASRASSRRNQTDRSRSGSTETIQVMISDEPYTPDQRPFHQAGGSPATLASTVYRPTDSTTTWDTQSTSRTPPQPDIPELPTSLSRKAAQMSTPTPAGRNSAGAGAFLGTPYSPSKYNDNGQGKVTDVLIGSDNGLRVVRDDQKRVTTFSAIMRKGGLDPKEFGMGTDSK